MTKALLKRNVNVTALLRQWATFDTVKTALFFYIVFGRYLKVYRHLRAYGLSESVKQIYRAISREFVLFMLKFPPQKQKVEKQLAEAVRKVEEGLVPKGPHVIRHLALPHQGRTPEWIVQEMDRMDREGPSKADQWKLGKLSGAVYHGGDDMEKVIVAAFQKYCVSNPLHPDSFPAVRKMEAEIVAMCLRLYNNPIGAGVTTSGGTESIVMAVKTYRDWARASKGITEPEMIVPVSAHAAFDKAAAYFNINLRSIPVDFETRKVDIRRVKRAINANTIMLVGSAINFPDGNMDDIAALSELAHRHKIGLHVDCCLGSFIVPFLEKAGYPIDPFDFRLEGVTSISCDTHKYGFAPKGSSVIMYRSAELRRYQYYVATEWPGGVYASPSLAGSRPGALIAGTWAALQYMGYDGYLDSCKAIVGCAKKIETSVRTEIPELYILGNPPASCIAFASNDEKVLNVHAVGDRMSKRGWHLNALSKPAGLHIACTRLTVEIVDTFIADLKECVQEAKGIQSERGNMVMLYGISDSSVVGPTMVGKLATAFIDTLYKA